MKKDPLTAANVQRITSGVLDAIDELLAEFVDRKRAADWNIINEGLFECERLNRELAARLLAVGVKPTKSRSK